jgi:hypothetical protein
MIKWQLRPRITYLEIHEHLMIKSEYSPKLTEKIVETIGFSANFSTTIKHKDGYLSAQSILFQ